jgi:rod shape-determining protein MreC
LAFSRRAREVLIVGALLAVPALVLRANTRAPSDLNWIDRLVLRATAPLQSGITRGVSSVGEAWRRYVYLVDVEGENRRLQEENVRLRAELERAEVGARRIDELERELGLRKAVPSETLAARVVGVDTSPYFRVIRVKLDRGEGEVKPGMPVLAPTGVVGSVRRVFGAYCDVLLAIDPESSIDVVALRSSGQGTLRGVANDYKYRARFLRSTELQEGDEIVTSGNDGVYPRDRVVGTVVKVSAPDSGLWKEAEVRPSVDFTKLSEVLVVLAPPPPPNPDGPEGTRRAPQPHRGLGAPR